EDVGAGECGFRETEGDADQGGAAEQGPGRQATPGRAAVEFAQAAGDADAEESAHRGEEGGVEGTEDARPEDPAARADQSPTDQLQTPEQAVGRSRTRRVEPIVGRVRLVEERLNQAAHAPVDSPGAGQGKAV